MLVLKTCIKIINIVMLNKQLRRSNELVMDFVSNTRFSMA